MTNRHLSPSLLFFSPGSLFIILGKYSLSSRSFNDRNLSRRSAEPLEGSSPPSPECPPSSGLRGSPHSRLGELAGGGNPVQGQGNPARSFSGDRRVLRWTHLTPGCAGGQPARESRRSEER